MAIIGVIITNPDGNSSPVIVVEPNRDSLIKVNPAASGDGVNSFTVVENVPVVKNVTTSYKTEVDVSADNSKTIYIGDSPVQMRATDTHIQWRNVKNSVWANLIALADFMGGTGADGREIELSSNATHLLWRYVGEAEWNNLIAISDFYVQSDWNQENPLSPEYIHNKPTIPIAIDGREIELQTSATHIQWRYVGDATWINLIALSALEGEQGLPGADGADGITPHIGEDGYWYIGTTNTGVQAEGQDGATGADGADGVGIASVTLISTAGLNKTYRITFTNATTFDYVVTDGADGEDGSPGTPGADGDDGREIELQTSLTHIQWRYVGSATWTNLVALSVITGPQGPPGDDAVLNHIIVSGKRSTSLGISSDDVTFPSDQINIEGSIISNLHFGSTKYNNGDILEVSGFITIDSSATSIEESNYVKIVHTDGTTNTEVVKIGFEIIQNNRITVPWNFLYAVKSTGTHRFSVVYPYQSSNNSVPYGSITVKRIYEG